MVRLPVCTFGSRMMAMPLETASMPVKVPPPSENARMKMVNIFQPPNTISPL